jgi:hypothetical protein
MMPESMSEPPELPLFNSMIGSDTLVFVVSMYVVVPSTVKLPLTVASPSTVSVWLICADSVSNESLILTVEESDDEIAFTTIASLSA